MNQPSPAAVSGSAHTSGINRWAGKIGTTVLVIVAIGTIAVIADWLIPEGEKAPASQQQQVIAQIAPTHMLCGVANPLPNWTPIQAPGIEGDTPTADEWAGAPVVDVPTPIAPNCTISVFNHKSADGTFWARCQDAYDSWHDLAPGTCTDYKAMRFLSKTKGGSTIPLELNQGRK